MLADRHVSSRRPRARARAAATGIAALLAAGLLTGCGNGDDAEPDVAPAPPAAVTVDPGAVIDGKADGSPSPDADAEADQSPSPSPSPDAAEAEPEASPEAAPVDCPTLQAAWNRTNQSLVNLSADHPRALVSSFRSAAESMKSIEEVPDGVAEPWTTMSRYLAKVNTALEPVDADDANAVAAAMAEAITAADTQAATAAGEKITAFVTGGCAAS